MESINLPFKNGIIVDLTTDSLRLLFQSFFDNKVTHSSGIKMKTCAKLNELSVAIATNCQRRTDIAARL